MTTESKPARPATPSGLPEQAGKPKAPAGPAIVQEQAPGEVNGPKGLEPTRYGDWERKGIVSDF